MFLEIFEGGKDSFIWVKLLVEYWRLKRDLLDLKNLGGIFWG